MVAKPVLIFDGDCGFCRYWIARWRHRTGDSVEYLPFQEPPTAQRFPELSRERLEQAVHLVEPDGTVTAGAHAVFRTLAISGSRLPLSAYERVPGIAAVSELAYRFVANHRPLFSRITLAFWGRGTRPSTYALPCWIFLRLIGAVYLAAFWSLGVQVIGLIGHDGILPASEYMAAAREWADDQQMGLFRVFVIPTLFWLNASDAFLKGICIGGAGMASLLLFGVAPAILLPLLWLTYLSLVIVCNDFLAFQWDTLLLETGLLAIFVAPLTRWDRLRSAAEPQRIPLWLLRWLLFRLIFGSGVVKLASGDPTWHGLTALTFHYETQPLPTPIAWYAHHLPLWFQEASTAAVLAVELAAPWLIVAPRRLRLIGCGILVTLQLLIALTGNYAFFNVLTIALCILLLDDEALGRTREPSLLARRRWPKWLVGAVACVTVPVSAIILLNQMGVEPPGSVVVLPLQGLVQPFRSVNGYGLFAVMTTTRPEIIVEGSNDGVMWLPYEFKDKPGDLRRSPPWVAPHQPRLDWQMWFAALSRYDYEPWLQHFLVRLLEGSPAVLGLVGRDPFQGKPPQLVRAVLYRYHFADAETRRTQRLVWTRERLGQYSPTLKLQQP